MQDYKLVNTGYVTEDGQTWFADVPEYSPGFTVGVLGELYLNTFLSLRFIPTLHFGDRKSCSANKPVVRSTPNP